MPRGVRHDAAGLPDALVLRRRAGEERTSAGISWCRQRWARRATAPARATRAAAALGDADLHAAALRTALTSFRNTDLHPRSLLGPQQRAGQPWQREAHGGDDQPARSTSTSTHRPLSCRSLRCRVALVARCAGVRRRDPVQRPAARAASSARAAFRMFTSP